MNKKRSFATWIARYPHYFCTAILSVVIIFSVTALSILIHARYREIEQLVLAKNVEAVDASVSMDEKTKYVLRDCSGRIGIFREEETFPYEILSVYTFTLPEADRVALRVGITVYGEDALRTLIEDFTG